MNRPRRAKANTKAKEEVKLPPKEKKPPTGDFYVDTYPSSESDSEQEPEDVEYGKSVKTKKRKSTSKHIAKTKSQVKKAKVRAPSPELSDLSEIDSECEREEDLPLFTKHNRTAPPVKATLTSKVLKLDIRSAPTTITINLADLFPNTSSTIKQVSDVDLDGDTLLVNAEESRAEPSKAQDTDGNSIMKMRRDPRYASFLEIEPELRNKIYRHFLLSDQVVKFNPAPRAGRETALLRTCKQVYEEGTGILYGGHAFHLSREAHTRARYFDNAAREVGYKDVRRFLETIGPQNIAKMRFLSMEFRDAQPVDTPGTTVEERRYVNDAVLMHVLKMIGRSGVILDNFVIGFLGRAEVTSNDVSFIRALTSIKCRDLERTCLFGHSRISLRLFPKIQNFMEQDGDEIYKERGRRPKMEHESRSLCHSCKFSWRCD